MGDLILWFLQWFESISWFVPFEEDYFLSAGIYAAHYFSFFVLVGTIAVVDLRLLSLAGQGRAVTQLAEQLFPWTWIGLGLASLTGFLYLTPSAWIFFRSSFFFTKLLLTFLAAVSVLLIQRNVRKWDQQAALPPQAKVMAVISLLLWISVLIAGTHVPVQTCF